MIEKDPTLPEAELLETLKLISVNVKWWTASENQKLLEAYELWGWDFSAISHHVGTKSYDQVHNKRQRLVSNMKSNPTMPMSHFLNIDSKVNRRFQNWTESEE